MNGLFLEIVEYIANSLLSVFSMDLAYFETAVPVSRDIFAIILAVGWALLLGNLVFQAMRSMVSGLGYEGEDPKLLFARTFLFSFLLLVSRQICDIGLGITATVIELLQVPSSIQIPVPDEIAFAIGASWLLVVIITVIILWQVVRMFFEVGERYVVTAVLTILSPLAFAMGGSKSTADIFKGWVRMFGSMCLMMVLNVVFLKMLLSVLAIMPSGTEMLPWTILVMGIARVARKIDAIVTRIGLNPAITGDGLGRSNLPGVLAFTVARSLGSTVARTIGKSGGHTPPASGGGTVRGGVGVGGRSHGGRERGGPTAQNRFAASTTHTASAQNSQAAASAGTASATQATAEAAQNGSHTASAFGSTAQGTINHAGEMGNGQRCDTKAANSRQNSSRRSAVSSSQRTGGAYGVLGRAGMARQTRNTFADKTHGPNPAVSPGAQTVRNEETTTSGTAGKPASANTGQSESTRFFAIPQTARQEAARAQAGTSGRVTRQSNISAQQTATETTRTEHNRTPNAPPPVPGRTTPERPIPGGGTAGNAGANVQNRPPQASRTGISGNLSGEPHRVFGAGVQPASPAQQERRPASGAAASREMGIHTAARPPEAHAGAGGAPRPSSPARQESRPSFSTAASKQGGSTSGTAGTGAGAPHRSRPNTPGKATTSTNTPNGGQATRRAAPGGRPVANPQQKPSRQQRGGVKRGR